VDGARTSIPFVPAQPDGTNLAVELLVAETSNPDRLSMIAFGDRRWRRAPWRVIDSLSGLEKRARQEFDGEVRSVGGGWGGLRRRSRAPSTAG
jgi:hypothetical protein